MEDEQRALFQTLLRRTVRPGSIPRPYHAFTTAFDREVVADELGAILGELKFDDGLVLEQAWRELTVGLALRRDRFADLVDRAQSSVRSAVSQEILTNAVVAVLIDQSSSMRGAKALYAVTVVDLCQRLLAGLGVGLEVLGFTTSAWHGGNSWREWVKLGRPQDPGRLNDLLHIVYRDADASGPLSDDVLRWMLRPDLRKENIDGEAILWAANRLRLRPEAHKILIVISDGEPSEAQTQCENNTDYLSDHLETVIGEVRETGDIALKMLDVSGESQSSSPDMVVLEVINHLAEEILRSLESMLSVPRGGGWTVDEDR